MTVKFDHKKDGVIEYHERDGVLWYSYEEREVSPTGDIRIFADQGVIPREMIERGVEAIRMYADGQVLLAIVLHKTRAKEQDEFEMNPDLEISTHHNGVLLRGRIIYATARMIKVRLENPLVGESNLNFGWVSAMAGKKVYSGHKELSPTAMGAARGLLVKIYDSVLYQEKNRDLIELSRWLNELD